MPVSYLFYRRHYVREGISPCPKLISFFLPELTIIVLGTVLCVAVLRTVSCVAVLRMILTVVLRVVLAVVLRIVLTIVFAVSAVIHDILLHLHYCCGLAADNILCYEGSICIFAAVIQTNLSLPQQIYSK